MRPTRMGAIAAAALTLACVSRGNTEENLRHALEQANIPDVAVDVDEEGRVVHLTGTVETLAERTRAEEVASAVVGTTGRVLNDLTVAGIDERSPQDEAITAMLNRMIDADPVLRERDVNFEVSVGSVTVTGEVHSLEEKNRVSEVVRGTPGVGDLSNDLEIATAP